MKVKYKGESDPLSLIHDKVYDVLSVEYGYYRIVDETGEDYLYEPDDFEVVEEGDVPGDAQNHPAKMVSYHGDAGP